MDQEQILEELLHSMAVHQTRLHSDSVILICVKSTLQRFSKYGKSVLVSSIVEMEAK